MDKIELWLVILGAAAGTFAMRMSFLGPWSRGKFPTWLDQALRFAPPVIFAALITPMILKTGQAIAPAELWSRVAAVAATLVWSLRFGGQVLPLAVGMLTLHGVRFIYGL
jgi:branched-subunit amino acid transport protein